MADTHSSEKTGLEKTARPGRPERRLARAMGRALEAWKLIEDGDRILVGVSGGKDSYTLLHLLRRSQKRAPVRFEIVAVHLDQGHPGFDSSRIATYLAEQGFEHRIVCKDTYSLVMEKIKDGDTTCSLCSRFRRGILYNQAAELGCNKVALGHHREDAIETLLLNMLYTGRTAGMPARLRTTDGRFELVRPLLYCSEEDIRAFAAGMDFPIEPCRLCTGTERDYIAEVLQTLSERNPNVRGNLLQAMHRIIPSHLLDKGFLPDESR